MVHVQHFIILVYAEIEEKARKKGKQEGGLKLETQEEIQEGLETTKVKFKLGLLRGKDYVLLLLEFKVDFQGFCVGT